MAITTSFFASSEAAGTTWSVLRDRLSHRLAMHVPMAGAQLANPRPMVSFTFDDVPHSAATVGAAALEAHGAHGTFYVSGTLVGERDKFWQHATAAQLADLHARGHELGCHTYSHIRASDLDPTTLEAEIARNRACFEELVPGARLANFAFPYGVGTFRGKRQLAQHFRTSRSIVPGINRGRVDLQFLKAVPLIDREIDRARLDDLMDAAVADNGWLIFFGHDVCRRPSAYGCSEALLDHALKGAKRRDLAIVSVAEGLQAARI